MDKYQGENLDTLSEADWQLLSTSFKTNKELEKTKFISQFILNSKVDICLFTEIGGNESIRNLNKHFLNDKFSIFYKPSNSDRGIDLAILVKKEIAPNFNLKSHNDKVFARGVFNLGLANNQTGIRILLTHLKSKLNKSKKDFEGRTQRKAEVKRIIKIAKDYPKDDIIICGDLNGIIYKDQTEEELSLFANNLSLFDVMEHQNSSEFERFTYIYYNNQRQAHMMQLDYALMTKETFTKYNITASVLDFDGFERKSIPSSFSQKRLYPSDHYPILMKLKL